MIVASDHQIVVQTLSLHRRLGAMSDPASKVRFSRKVNASTTSIEVFLPQLFACDDWLPIQLLSHNLSCRMAAIATMKAPVRYKP